MEPRVRASPEQFSLLLDFMERHGDLSKPQQGPQGRSKSERLWVELANVLNSLGGGCQKSSEKWKKRPSNEVAMESGSGIEPALGHSIAEEDHSQSVLNGIQATIPITSPLPPTPPPPPLTPPPHSSRIQPDPSHSNRQPAADSPWSSPRTPRRALLRARRNRGLTPFERAAQEFAAVEQRRLIHEEARDRRFLEYEEARDRRLHEREMERLRLESQRIEVARNQNELLHQLGLLAQRLIDVITQQRQFQSLPSTDPM